MAKKKIKEESTVDTTLSFEQRVANKLGLSEQDNTLIKKANESSGLTMSGMSHYPWRCAEPGFAVETKAPRIIGK